jgi:hypothetical protein
MATLVADLRQLPTGAHCISFHTTREEAARHAVSFIAGTPPGQAVSYWVPDSESAAYYKLWLAREAPDHVGCVAILPREQVEKVDGKLRPVQEVRQFVQGNPEGVTGGADTISRYWTPENVPDHLEYEAWFESQPRQGSRFLCPYDLRAVPPDVAPQVLRELGSHHSHVALSNSPEPGVRLLQLFVFPNLDEMPGAMDANLGWAVRMNLVDIHGPLRELFLTTSGEQVIKDWGEHTTIDW